MSEKNNNAVIFGVLTTVLAGSVFGGVAAVIKTEVNASDIKKNSAEIKEIKSEQNQYFLEIRQELRKMNDKLYELHKEKK